MRESVRMSELSWTREGLPKVRKLIKEKEGLLLLFYLKN